MTPISALLVSLATLALAGCATTDRSQPPSPQQLSQNLKAQFGCADRNANNYIDQTELVYLPACGIGEDLKCGEVPENMDARPSGTELEAGRRILKVVDADGDDRISRLEFRAHCNSTGKAD